MKRFGEPTWVKLVEAVSDSAGGGNPSLAMEIARRHGGMSMILRLVSNLPVLSLSVSSNGTYKSGQHGNNFTPPTKKNRPAQREKTANRHQGC